MVGKIVKVIDNQDEDWIGEILSVKDAETFIIKKETLPVEVSIFDIRSLQS